MNTNLSIRIITCLALLLLSAGQLSAQNFRNDFTKSSRFFQAPKLHYHFSAKIYANANSPSPLEVINGDVQKFGNAYKMKYGEVTTLVNDNIYLLIDNESKEMFVSENNVNLNQQFRFDSTLFEQILNRYDSIRLLSANSQTIRYAVYNSASYIHTSIISLSAKDKRLLKLVYHYNPAAGFDYEKVVVDFTYKDTGSLNESAFRTSKYLVFGKEAVLPAESYSAYRIKHIRTE